MKGTYNSGYIKPETKSLAENKYLKFLKYSQIFPEYQLLFIGDNGQGDLLAGIKMIFSNQDCYVFIHNIIENDKRLFSIKDIEKFSKFKRLFFFNNYYQLGKIFFRLNLFNKNDLNIINNSFLNDINLIQ